MLFWNEVKKLWRQHIAKVFLALAAALLLFFGELHLSTLFVILDGVIKEVIHHLFENLTHAVYLLRLAVNQEADAPLRCLGNQALVYLPAKAEQLWYGLSPKPVGDSGSICHTCWPARARKSTKSYAPLPSVPMPNGPGRLATGIRMPLSRIKEFLPPARRTAARLQLFAL